MKPTLVFRVRILSGLFILVAALLAVRLYFLQIVHGEKYREDAVGQYVQDAPDFLDRSDIFFTKRDGSEVAAAVMQSGWRVAIQPKVMTNIDEVYTVLSELIDLDRDRFYVSANKTNDPYEEIAFLVSDEVADAIRLRKLDGVLTVKDQWRRYPGGELAAHAIGFVGYRGDVREGVYGLERYYDDTLKRESAELYVNPFAEIFTNVAAVFATDPQAQTGSVITSIEPNAQTQLERVLGAVEKKHAAQQVGGIIMDPKTGEIIAMATLPTFDLNSYNTAPSTAVYANPMIESLFEMGSIMKPLTMAAGIDLGVVSPKTMYEDRGYVMKSGKKISNFDGRGRGRVSMQEVLSQSLNTGMAFVVDKMGKEKFANYMRAYGLGEETGIDLPNEIAGNIAVFDQNADVDFASAAFGQSIAVTPIAMIRALSSLANGGVLSEPHIARAVRSTSGIERSIPQAPATRVLKPETVDTVTRMLVTVYDDALLEGALKQEHYSIAAKTGTAQFALPECHGYCEGRFFHSFFGYFPAYEPRFIVLLFAMEPHGEVYASRTLARPFLDLAKFLINYYDVPPDR